MAEEFTPEKAVVRELVRKESKAITDSFSGILKAVVPDVTRGLAQAARGFRQSLLKGTNETITDSYVNLQKFLKTFNVNIGDLGNSFKDVEKAYEGLTTQLENVDKEINNLREKNIAAEMKIVIDRNKGNIQAQTILMSDQDVIKKRKEILKVEQDLKKEEKEVTKELRQFQKGEKELNQQQKINLLSRISTVQEELNNIEAAKKLYSGKGGRFDLRVGGFIDNFERALQDKAPDFLTAALGPVIDFARQFQKTVTLLIDGIQSTAKFIGKFLPDSFKKGFASMFGSLKKTVSGLIGTLATFGKRIILTGITMLASIVAPLLPLLVPLLKFAVVVGLVVGGLMLLKKGFDALTDWFKNSWLGKKIFGGDKGKEPEKEKTKDSSIFDKLKGFSFGKKEKEKEKPKVVANEEETISLEKKPAKVIATEEKDAFGDTQFESFMQDKEMKAFMKGEETTSMKKNRVREETEALRKEKIYGDNEAENKIMQLAEEKYGGFEVGYEKAKAELYPELAAKEKELEALIKKEEEEKLAAKKEFVERKVKTKSTQKVTTTETVTGGDETVKSIGDEERDNIKKRNKIHSEYDEKINELMDSPEYKRMSADERLSAIVKLENERRKKTDLPPLTDAKIKSFKKGIELDMKQEKKIMPTAGKKDLTLDAGQTGGQPIVINNVTAPQNVASTSTQQVVAANAAKSNDDTFLNLNRHV